MSTFLHVNSSTRDRVEFPNPADFDIPRNISAGFKADMRSVHCVRPHCKPSACNLVYCTKLLHLVLPFSEDLWNAQPGLFVQLSSSELSDKGLINTTIPNVSRVNFFLVTEKTQGDAGGGVPLWIHYSCKMNQCMRFDQKGVITFAIYLTNGTILSITDTTPPVPFDPAQQVNALFEFTPYAIDGTYENHLVSLYDNQTA